MTEKVLRQFDGYLYGPGYQEPGPPRAEENPISDDFRNALRDNITNMTGVATDIGGHTCSQLTKMV